MRRKVVCFHLLNDYSGSPKVLKTVLDGLCEKGMEVELITSGTHGVLDELAKHQNFKMRTYCYNFSNNHVITMVRYVLVQVLTFFLAWRYIFHRNAVFYINTLLPIGPALAGRMMGKRVVYHYHENAYVKGLFYKLLAAGMQKIADDIICVSKYQRQYLKRQYKIIVIHNALPDNFIEKLTPNIEAAYERKTILMLGSLKEYKGTSKFVQLAAQLPQYQFTLVINDTKENINAFVKIRKITIPKNLIIYARQKDVSIFYNNSSIVLNLSNKNQFVETFGLTALEAMSAGLPVIVPTVGGIAELIENDRNGYKIDVQHLDKIRQTIVRMLNDKCTYIRLAANALNDSKVFSEINMINRISEMLWKY